MRWPTAFVANDCRPQAPAYNRAVRTLYRASRVHTFSLPPEGEWVLIDGRHVERVGSGDPPAADRVVELPGSTIVPGMIDTHVHLTGTGVHLAHPQIARARSAAELTSTLREICAGRDGPTLVHGFDESTWDDPRLPSMSELDAVTRQALVVVRVDGHLSLGNRPAVQSAGVLDAPGAEALREGGPAAVVTLEANDSPEALGELAARRWGGAGAAARRRCGGGLARSDLRPRDVHAGGAGPARSRCADATSRSTPGRRRHLRRHDGYPSGDGPRPAEDRGDLPVDGSIGAHTAALQAPYADRPDTSGTLAFAGDELVEFVHGGHAAGLQVGVHAIGDRAIDQVLTTWERVYGTLDSRERRHFRARRHRIEHFEMASQVQIERAGMLGLALSFQPAFDSAWGAAGQACTNGASVRSARRR